MSALEIVFSREFFSYPLLPLSLPSHRRIGAEKLELLQPAPHTRTDQYRPHRRVFRSSERLSGARGVGTTLGSKDLSLMQMESRIGEAKPTPDGSHGSLEPVQMASRKWIGFWRGQIWSPMGTGTKIRGWSGPCWDSGPSRKRNSNLIA